MTGGLDARRQAVAHGDHAGLSRRTVGRAGASISRKSKRRRRRVDRDRQQPRQRHCRHRPAVLGSFAAEAGREEQPAFVADKDQQGRGRWHPRTTFAGCIMMTCGSTDARPPSAIGFAPHRRLYCIWQAARSLTKPVEPSASGAARSTTMARSIQPCCLNACWCRTSSPRPAPVYRKDAWLAAGGLDENLWYTGDWDIWLKLAAQGPVCHHREVTTAFRVHGSSLTVTGSRDAADFERQMQIVLDRHLPRLAAHRGRVHRAGIASIKVNGALAAAASGRLAPLLPALGRVLALGPAGIHRYIRDSRIADRLIPRVRAKLMGSF